MGSSGHALARFFSLMTPNHGMMMQDMARNMNGRLSCWLVNLTAEQRAGIGVLAVDYESFSDHVQCAIRLNLERACVQEFTLPVEEIASVTSV